jgi:hypothetical protein
MKQRAASVSDHLGLAMIRSSSCHELDLVPRRLLRRLNTAQAEEEDTCLPARDRLHDNVEVRPGLIVAVHNDAVGL